MMPLARAALALLLLAVAGFAVFGFLAAAEVGPWNVFHFLYAALGIGAVLGIVWLAAAGRRD